MLVNLELQEDNNNNNTIYPNKFPQFNRSCTYTLNFSITDNVDYQKIDMINDVILYKKFPTIIKQKRILLLL